VCCASCRKCLIGRAKGLGCGEGRSDLPTSCRRGKDPFLTRRGTWPARRGSRKRSAAQITRKGSRALRRGDSPPIPFKKGLAYEGERPPMRGSHGRDGLTPRGLWRSCFTEKENALQRDRRKPVSAGEKGGGQKKGWVYLSHKKKKDRDKDWGKNVHMIRTARKRGGEEGPSGGKTLKRNYLNHIPKVLTGKVAGEVAASLQEKKPYKGGRPSLNNEGRKWESD